MPSASGVVKTLDCSKCGKPLVRNSKVMCPRHKKEIELPASLPRGKWFCPECQAHGFEKPRTLAINDQIKCRWCGEKNSLIQKEEKMVDKYDLEKIFQEIEKCVQELNGGCPIGDADVYHMIVNIHRGQLSPQGWRYEVTFSMIGVVDPKYDYPSAPHIECRGTGDSFGQALADVLAELMGRVQLKRLNVIKRS